MSKIRNVCLDTSVIRTLIHENNDFAEQFFKIAFDHKVKFQIAETAWAEIVDDLYDGSIKMEDWVTQKRKN